VAQPQEDANSNNSSTLNSDAIMNIDKWCKLSADERNELRRGWNKSKEAPAPDVYRLLEEARDLFFAEYGTHSEIYDIQTWHWYGKADYRSRSIRHYNEPTIAVLTSLHNAQRIESLPDRFMTFAVTQEPMADQIEGTIQVWRDLANQVFDMSKERVNELIELCWEGLCGRDIWFYHESAVYYFTPHAISKSVEQSLELRECELAFKLQNAIEGNESYSDYSKKTDWKTIREHVQRILRENPSAG
tara:strand:+ start:1851 stop:2585 length:735 start_codon:yes stop_codon:yes gene_type:complete